MKLSEQQIKAVISLPAQKRYEHFVKQVADSEEVWGLYNDGWAIATSNEGKFVFPVWSSFEYAEMCATGDWTEYKPKMIELEEFTDELLPNLAEDDYSIGVAYLPKDEGVVIDAHHLISDIEEELQKY